MENTGKLKGKTIFITGASRGIGKAIALKAARDGANIVIAAKTAEPHPKLPGTIYTAAEEVEKAGGKALAVVCDVRNEEQVKRAVQMAVEKFGGIDILINNASAIKQMGTEFTSMKEWDLMQSISTRGTFLVSKECLPYLTKSSHAHIINISPPLVMEPTWFAPYIGYTISKYGMSMCVLGMAEEFRDQKVGVNALWPRTIVRSSAVDMLSPGTAAYSRHTGVMADAAYAVMIRDPSKCTGNFFIDEQVLLEAGVKDFKQYACVPENADELYDDFFIPQNWAKL